MAGEIFHPGQWGGQPEMRPHHTSIRIHSLRFQFYLTAMKKGIHVLLHFLITAARAVMGDSSPISWASSHFLSVLKVLWKRLAWGIYSRAKETQREGGHVKHTFMTPETDWTHSTSPSLKEKTEEINKKESETLIEQPWVDWVKDEGIEDPVGALPHLPHTPRF